jgi:hypothetical protein
MKASVVYVWLPLKRTTKFESCHAGIRITRVALITGLNSPFFAPSASMPWMLAAFERQQIWNGSVYK